MKKRKAIALLLLIIGIGLSIAFLIKIEFPQGFETYFKREYYNQFGPLAISVELLSPALQPLSLRPAACPSDGVVDLWSRIPRHQLY